MAIKNVAMIGTGAVGGVYAMYLHQTYGKQFYVIADEKRKARIEEKGICVNGTVYFPQVIEPKEASLTMDLIIFGVKNYDLEQAIIDVKNFVGKETCLLPLLNGITASDRIQSAYPFARTLLGLSMGIDAIRTSEGIVNTSNGIIQFGYENNEVISVEVEEVRDYFVCAGLDARVYPDMRRMLWRKWMLNVGVNQASAITGAKFKYFGQNKELLTLFRRAMQEVLELAMAAKVNLTVADLEDIEQVVIHFTPEGKTSMLQDVEACRKTEIDYFAGTVLEYGKQLEVPTPVNYVLYLALKAQEQIYLADR